MNKCRYCNKEINGLSVCGCFKGELEKLWDSKLREKIVTVKREQTFK